MRSFQAALMVCLATIVGNVMGEEMPRVFVSAFNAGEKAAIHSFRLNSETGELEAERRTLGVHQPFFLALSPDRRFLYSTTADKFGGKEEEAVVAFEIESSSGELKELNRQSTRGAGTCYLDVSGDGSSLLLANYSTGSVAALPITSEGRLGESTSFIQHTGTSVNPDRQKAPFAHCIITSPDDRFAFAADLGIDKILCYRLNSKRAGLSPNKQPFVRTLPGAGPRHLVFHPDGQHLYAINELSNSVTHFAFDKQAGFLVELSTVNTLPDGYDELTHCADLKITPDGRFLYATNRGHDSLAIFEIMKSGELKSIDIVSSHGGGPQNLAITGDGRWLLCANMPGNNLAVFRINAQTGQLTLQGEPVEMPMPSCIMLLEESDARSSD